MPNDTDFCFDGEANIHERLHYKNKKEIWEKALQNQRSSDQEVSDDEGQREVDMEWFTLLTHYHRTIDRKDFHLCVSENMCHRDGYHVCWFKKYAVVNGKRISDEDFKRLNHPKRVFKGEDLVLGDLTFENEG